MAYDSKVGVHPSVDAILCARKLILLQCIAADFSLDAFCPAYIGKMVDGYSEEECLLAMV